ncbi:response regulator [Spirosoma aerophilum]
MKGSPNKNGESRFDRKRVGMLTNRVICVVDGAIDFRLALEDVFFRYLPYYSVRFFSTEQAFLDALPHMQLKPSLILLDQALARLGGHQVEQALQGHPIDHSIPVVRLLEPTDEDPVDSPPLCPPTSLRKHLDRVILRETLSELCFTWLEAPPLRGNYIRGK